MVLIEPFSCTSKEELFQRERLWYEKLRPSLNMRCPGVSVQESNEKYMIQNSDKLHEKRVSLVLCTLCIRVYSCRINGKDL
jgi:hypothetical protein